MTINKGSATLSYHLLMDSMSLIYSGFSMKYEGFKSSLYMCKTASILKVLHGALAWC